MKFIDNFKENKKKKKKCNSAFLDLQVANAEIDRKDIIIDELKEAVASVRKIWMDANNEKELKIVELNEKINELKRNNRKGKNETNK